MGMIFGGTGVQTLILLIITIRFDWEEEVWIECTMLQVFLISIRFTFEHMFMDGLVMCRLRKQACE